MGRRVGFTDQAKADLRAIPQPVALQILRTLARFLDSGEGDVKRLQGIEPPIHRLRTQNHRVLFRITSQDEIEVIRVRDRKNAYK
jgi:mRNA-degrading endonuclease RelE of RelBE toxin-antitoxin system